MTGEPLNRTLPQSFREMSRERVAAEVERARKFLYDGSYGCKSRPRIHTPGEAVPRRCSACNTRELALENFVRRPDHRSWTELLRYVYKFLPAPEITVPEETTT